MANLNTLINNSTATASTSTGNTINPLVGIGGSVLDEIATLFGADDLVGGAKLEQWQLENPGLHLTSQLAGLLIPYAGWEYAASKITLRGGSSLRTIAQATSKRNGIVTNPFMRGVVENAVVFAPFEAIRGTAMLANGKGLGDTAADVGFSLGVGAVAGGAIGAARAFGSRQKLLSGDHWIPKTIGYTAEEWQVLPAQRVLRDLDTMVNAKGGTWAPEAPEWDDILRVRQNLRSHVMNETIKPFSKASLEAFPERAVWEVSNGRGKDIGAKLGELFEIPATTSTRKTGFSIPGIKSTVRPMTSTKGYGDFQAEWLDVVGQPLDSKALSWVQYPRMGKLRANKAEAFGEWADKNLTQIGKNSWMTREGSEGMFVMVKRKGDKIAQWKTDDPRFWNKAGGKHLAGVTNLYTTLGTKTTQGNKAYRPFVINREIHKHSMTGAYHADMKANVQGALVTYARANDVARKGLQQALGGNVLGPVGKLWKELLAPGSFKYADPVAHIMRTSLHEGYRLSVSRVMRNVLGDVPEKIGVGAILGNLGKVRKPSKLVRDINKLKADKNATENLLRVINTSDRPLSYAIKTGAPQVVVDILKQMDTNAATFVDYLQTTQRALGMKPMASLREHLGLVRKWDDWVVPVYENGAKVSVLSAPTKRGAEKAADTLLKDARAAGLDLHLGDPYDWHKGVRVSYKDAVAKPIDMDNMQREIFLAGSFGGKASNELSQLLTTLRTKAVTGKRSGVEGYKTIDTLEDLMDNHLDGLLKVSKFENSLAHNATFSNDLMSLGARNPEEYNKLLKETGALQAGVNPGHAIEQALNNVLSPVLGKGGAEKMAAALNSTMYVGTLGIGNIAFATLNVLSPIMQTLPHIAYLRKAPDSRVAHFYQTLPALDRQKRLMGSFSFLSPMKIGFSSARRLHKPDQTMNHVLRKAVSENILDQGMLDAAVGQDSVMGAIAKPWAASHTSIGEVSNSLLKGATFMADRSERFARLYSLSVGVEVGEKLMKINDPDKLYKFAASFVNNTMFSYRMVDRASAFQGPFGSMLGLFKTWMTNYIAWTAEYAGTIGHGGGAALAQANLYTGLIGGVGATPVGQIADVFSRLATDKTLTEQLYGNFSPDAADAIHFGLPSFAGVSLQGSVSLPGANGLRDIEMLYNIASLQMAGDMAGVIGDGFSNWYQTGDAPWESTRWRNSFIRATQMKTFYRFAAATQDAGINSLNTGYPALRNPTVGDKLAYIAGFNPDDLAREYEAYEVGARVQERNQGIRRRLALQYMDGLATGDLHDFQIALRSYPQFNMDQILRSVRGIQRQETLSPTARSVRDKQALQRASVIQPDVLLTSDQLGF